MAGQELQKRKQETEFTPGVFEAKAEARQDKTKVMRMEASLVAAPKKKADEEISIRTPRQFVYDGERPLGLLVRDLSFSSIMTSPTTGAWFTGDEKIGPEHAAVEMRVSDERARLEKKHGSQISCRLLDYSGYERYLFYDPSQMPTKQEQKDMAR